MQTEDSEKKLDVEPPQERAEMEEGTIIGASLLCFSVDPEMSKIYFLLGKERRNAKWAGGSQLWSDFGGSTTTSIGRDSAENTAAREFVEETMCTVRYFPRDRLPRSGWEDIAQSLREGNYLLRLIQYCGTEEDPKSYITFVTQIPWDPHTPTRFYELRGEVTGGTVKKHPAIHRGVIQKQYIEKSTVEWWSVPQLTHASEHGGVLGSRHGAIERCKAAFYNSLPTLLSELQFIDPEIVEE